jgi:electron-transferring-flavoprotein dehydrogenase
VWRDLYRTRNMRLAFKHGFVGGAVRAGLMTVTGGRFPGGRISVGTDAAAARQARDARQAFTPDGRTTFSKVDAVFKSGNTTRDAIPSHLVVGGVDEPTGRFLSHLCPAGVYEWTADGLKVNAPNCVDCKATDILGPRWTPREGGSGPKYKRM